MRKPALAVALTVAALAPCACASAGTGTTAHRTRSAPLSPVSPVSPVSLTLLHGNAIPLLSEELTVTDGVAHVTVARRAGVRARWRTTHTRKALNAVLRAALAADVRRARPQSWRVSGACHGGPVGDIGGWLLTIGTARTDCPPPTAQPLLRLLEGLFPSVRRRS